MVLIGIKNSDFNSESYAQLTQDNIGPSEMTTADVLKGWNDIKDDVLTPEFIELVKQSPMFVSSRGGQ